MEKFPGPDRTVTAMFVLAVLVKPVALFTIVIKTSGRTAPERSVTTPFAVPQSDDWAMRVPPNSRNAQIRISILHCVINLVRHWTPPSDARPYLHGLIASFCTGEILHDSYILWIQRLNNRGPIWIAYHISVKNRLIGSAPSHTFLWRPTDAVKPIWDFSCRILWALNSLDSAGIRFSSANFPWYNINQEFIRS